MEKLIKNILERLSADEREIVGYEWVDNFVCQSQRQFPGSWQDWNEEERAKSISHQIRNGLREGETTVERILL